MSLLSLTQKLLYGELSPNEVRQAEGRTPDTEWQEKEYRRKKNLIFKPKKYVGQRKSNGSM